MRKIFVWAVLLLAAGPARADGPAMLAAAASLRPVLPQIMERFRNTGRGEVEAAYGATGALYRQILRGAPFELFLAADPVFTARLVGQGRADGEARVYALGRVALYAHGGSPLDPEQGCRGLESLLESGRLRRFAIPNPEHAPYGRAAREVLHHCGLWARIRAYLVIGENAAQAAGFAMQPSVQGGLVPLSLARSDALARRGRHRVIPQAWHGPLRHELVVLRGAGATARAFAGYLEGGEARDLLERAGFTVPVPRAGDARSLAHTHATPAPPVPVAASR